MRPKKFLLKISNKVEKFCEFWGKFFKDVADTSAVHGLNYLSDVKLHILEKFFWLVMIIGAVYGSYYVCMTQYRRYQASPTVVSLERDYRHWNGTLPAVTLCYQDHIDPVKADQFILKMWNTTIVDEDYFNYMEFLYAVVNSTASNYEDIVRFAEDERFADIDLFEVAKSIDRSFDHAIIAFDPNIKVDVESIMTERGMCYGINSPMSQILKDRKVQVDKYRKAVSCQYEKQQCYLKLEIYETGTIEIHSPYEVSVTDSEVISLQKSDEISGSYKIMETVASESLRDLSPTQRKCVFQDENTSGLQIYSKTLCLMKCRAIMALEMCSCVPFFYPFVVDGPSCNPAGFECLQDFKWPIWALHICKCPSTCTELKYSAHLVKTRSWSIEANIPLQPKSSFRWDILQPKIRIRRDVLFSFEDLMVSFGGAAALFLGISFYSALDIVLVILKHVFTGFLLVVKKTMRRR